MTPVIEQEVRRALSEQASHLPRIRREVVASLTVNDTAATILQRTIRACCDARLRMTQKQFSDFFETIFRARQEQFPHRLIFNIAGV